MKADFKDSHPKPPGNRRSGKRAPKRPNTKRGATAHKAGHAGWPWLLAGVLIGLFAAFIWYLNQNAPTVPARDAAPLPPHPTTQAPAPDATTIVPRAEPSQARLDAAPPAPAASTPVDAAPEAREHTDNKGDGRGDENAERAAEAAPDDGPDWHFYQLLEEERVDVPVDRIRAPRATQAPDPSQRMALQVGSFRKLEDADRLKARLALMNYEARIVVTESEKYGLWHRVRLGPYDDPRELGRDRAKLFTKGIESLPIQLDR